MRINKAITTIMKKEGWSQKQMATAIGKQRPNDVSARLATKNMSFDKAIEMLAAMGYEVVVQPVTAGQRKDGAIVISSEDEDNG
jgi:predicted XRE-type DNA-binding protein